jgi:hypothetical protein
MQKDDLAGFKPGATALAVILAAFVVGAPNARAQALNRLTQPAVSQPDDKTTKLPLPPAVPGSKPNSAAPAPAERQALDMPPTDALFDAINRGDIVSAKDAMSRGADLTAHNVLGLTPLDLSVDLGRNDISFLLLSLRSADGSGSRTANVSAPVKPKPDSHPRPQPREVIKAPIAPQTAQLFAGNGGAAVPQAGFLGFGTARTGP